MELKKRFSIKKFAILVYFVSFFIYLIYTLQPVEASNYVIDNTLSIPEISLTTDVTALALEGEELKTPDTIVGSFSLVDNKILLIGHSSTVFKRLHELKLGDTFYYGNDEYRIVSTQQLLKSSVDMSEILSSEEKDTVVLMTCAGQDLGGGDFTHRLIITAVK